MKASFYARLACSAITALTLAGQSAVAQESENPLDPANFKTPITKQLAENAGDFKKVKSIMTSFINTSKYPLACKLALWPYYELLLTFDANLQNFLNSKSEALAKNGNIPGQVEEWQKAENKVRFDMGKITAAKLIIGDQFCSSK